MSQELILADTHVNAGSTGCMATAALDIASRPLPANINGYPLTDLLDHQDE